MPKVKPRRSSRRNSTAASSFARRSPTPAYLAAAAVQSKPRSIGSVTQRHKPQLVVLDLNGTLCVRPKKTAKGARKAIPRPYVSAFLEYLLGVDEDRQPRFAVMIWSSAQNESVSTMLARLGLGTTRSGGGYLLEAIWDRQSFGLSPEDFHRKVEVIKDLDKIWSILRYQASETSPEEKWSQRDTFLIDDSPHKAVLQPSNHLCIPEYTLAAGRAFSENRSKEEDTALLEVIGVLEALRQQSNISACLKEGAWLASGGELKSQKDWESAGRATLDRLGIAAKPQYDEKWVVGAKESRNENTLEKEKTCNCLFKTLVTPTSLDKCVVCGLKIAKH